MLQGKFEKLQLQVASLKAEVEEMSNRISVLWSDIERCDDRLAEKDREIEALKKI